MGTSNLELSITGAADERKFNCILYLVRSIMNCTGNINLICQPKLFDISHLLYEALFFFVLNSLMYRNVIPFNNTTFFWLKIKDKYRNLNYLKLRTKLYSALDYNNNSLKTLNYNW